MLNMLIYTVSKQRLRKITAMENFVFLDTHFRDLDTFTYAFLVSFALYKKI